MPNPAFIVEGHMEQRFVSDICPKKPVRRIGCNGDDVSMAVMAKFLETQIRTLRNCYPIVVVFDRERRDETSEQLRETLLEELATRGVDTQNLIIAVADRTIENWIIADSQAVPSMFPKCRVGDDQEGSFGKTVLKRELRSHESYNETTTGVSLLKATNPNRARQNSPSLEYLLERLEIDCWWLDVTSRKLVRNFLEQLWFEFVPVFHGLQGRFAAQD